jgi:hypothetical protein
MMAKSVHDTVLDAAFAIIDNATVMTVCSAEPTTRALAITAGNLMLADVVMAPGDFVVANGTTSGRKVTVAAKSAVPVDANGTGNHIALCDASNLLYVTTCTAQVLATGNTVNFPAWEIEIADPT